MTEASDSIPLASIAEPGGLEDVQINNIKLQREVRAISSKYTKLLKNTVNTREHRATLEDFFFDCIEEVKKIISGRKNIGKVELADFRSSDKLSVLLRLLAREEIVQAVHQIVFRGPKTQSQDRQHPQKKPNVFGAGSPEDLLPSLQPETNQRKSRAHQRAQRANNDHSFS